MKIVKKNIFYIDEYDRIVITDKYAMLDCCKSFILNTETKQIVPWIL